MSHMPGPKSQKKNRDAKLLRRRRRNQLKGHPTFEVKKGFSPRQRRKYADLHST
jgi:hypothetical protein